MQDIRCPNCLTAMRDYTAGATENAPGFFRCHTCGYKIEMAPVTLPPVVAPESTEGVSPIGNAAELRAELDSARAQLAELQAQYDALRASLQPPADSPPADSQP